MSSEKDTLEHREKVIGIAKLIMGQLVESVMKHDESKIQEPELSIFDEYTSRLKNTTYGSDEYKGYLKEMGKALEHHYKANRHHPEYFENGIQGMNLVDVVEMFCDWWAASMRHNDGDIRRSIEINQDRFGYSDDLKAVLMNTVSLFNM